MKYLLIAILIVGAHFSLTRFAASPAGKAWIAWPFAADSKPILPALGAITPLAAGVAGSCFLAAALGVFGWLVPAAWVRPLVLAGSGASGLLYLAYFGPFAILPLALDAVLVWGEVSGGWFSA